MDCTALHRAVENNHFLIAQFLALDCFADVNAKKKVRYLII
jgi:hypothetical protein